MGDFNWLRLGAYAGLAFAVSQVAMAIPPLLGGVPPDLADASRFADYVAGHRVNLLSADWISSLGLVVFVAFLASVRHSIRSAGGDWEWAAGVVFASGVSWAAIRLLHNGLLMAGVLDTTEKGEPVAVKALTEAGYAVGFTVVWLFACLFIATASYVVHRNKVLPRWIAWLGFVVAGLNFITSLAIFGGGNGTALGGVNIGSGLLPLVIWVASVSVAMLRSPHARQRALPNQGDTSP